MRLLSCITDIDEIPVFGRMGVDEVYFAVGDVPNYANTGAIGTAAEAAAVISKAHAHGMKVFLAANALEDKLRDKQMKGLLGRIRSAAAAGIDGLIVANPRLLRLFADERTGVPLHLSSVQPCFNSAAAEFFVGRFGVSRIILPNQLAAAEAAGILRYCREAGVQTEVFFYKFFGCPYINGACYLHKARYYTLKGRHAEGNMCRIGSGGSLAKVSLESVFEPDGKAIARTAARLSLRFSRGGAPRLLNAASFFDYCLAGVDCIKYGTRTDGTGAKLRALGVIKSALRAAEELAARFPAAEARRRFVKMEEG